MGEQRLLDLGGGHVLATRDDRVRDPALDGQVAYLVDVAAIAGVEPTLPVQTWLQVSVMP
jgi:hypothetical protein